MVRSLLNKRAGIDNLVWENHAEIQNTIMYCYGESDVYIPYKITLLQIRLLKESRDTFNATQFFQRPETILSTFSRHTIRNVSNEQTCLSWFLIYVCWIAALLEVLETPKQMRTSENRFSSIVLLPNNTKQTPGYQNSCFIWQEDSSYQT